MTYVSTVSSRLNKANYAIGITLKHKTYFKKLRVNLINLTKFFVLRLNILTIICRTPFYRRLKFCALTLFNEFQWKNQYNANKYTYFLSPTSNRKSDHFLIPCQFLGNLVPFDEKSDGQSSRRPHARCAHPWLWQSLAAHSSTPFHGWIRARVPCIPGLGLFT